MYTCLSCFLRNWVSWTYWTRRVGFPRAQTRAFWTNCIVLTKYEEGEKGRRESELGAVGGAGKEGRERPGR